MCLIGTGLKVMRVAEVRLQEGESIDNALRRFKRKVQTENIIGEVKRHSYYLKPGVAVRPSTHFFAMFLPAFALAQSFAACESTPTEMHSIRETDFDCFASTGVNTPAQCPRASVVACVKNVAIATWDISDLTTLGFGIVC